MQASDVMDREALQNWLRTRPMCDSISIAHRAALRMAPMWFSAMAVDWAHKNELTALPLVRLNLTSGVALSDRSAEVLTAMWAADDALALAAHADETCAETDAGIAESFAAAETATKTLARTIIDLALEQVGGVIRSITGPRIAETGPRRLSLAKPTRCTPVCTDEIRMTYAKHTPQRREMARCATRGLL